MPKLDHWTPEQRELFRLRLHNARKLREHRRRRKLFIEQKEREAYDCLTKLGWTETKPETS